MENAITDLQEVVKLSDKLIHKVYLHILFDS